MSKFKSPVLPDDVGTDDDVVQFPTPLEEAIAEIKNEEEPEESAVNKVIHEPRPETTPPVTGATMPL